MAEVPRSFIHEMLRSQSAIARADSSDAELLDAFVNAGDPLMFELLVRRHAGLVWRICRGMLDNDHDAEDAFQATFLVFVRKAGSIKPAGMVANWLYGVARNTAQKARALIRKRRVRERLADVIPEPAQEPNRTNQDLREIIDLELAHLSANYRTPILLCDLEGLSRREACQRLGWLDGTLSGRLARGRAMLARRLIRRGFGTVAVGEVRAFATRALGAGSIRPASLAAVILMGKDSSPTVGISKFAFTLAGKVSQSMSIFAGMRAVGGALILTTLVCGSGLALNNMGPEPGQEKGPPAKSIINEVNSEKTETDLLVEMQAAAQREWEIRTNQATGGKWDLDHLSATSGRLLKANLGLARTSADHVNARKRQFQRMSEIEKTVRARHEAGQMDAASFENAKFARSEAELEFLREQSRTNREPQIDNVRR